MGDEFEIVNVIPEGTDVAMIFFRLRDGKVLPPEQTAKFSHFLKEKFGTGIGIVMLPPGTDVDVLDEQDMRKLGWRRLIDD